MNSSSQRCPNLVTLEAKLLTLYFSALAGASLSDIEVCRIGEWGCEHFSGALLVLEGATPMLIILLMTPMTRRGLVTISFIVFASMLWLGINAARSVGTVASLDNVLNLWIFGIFIVVALLVISKGSYDRRAIRGLHSTIVGSVPTESTVSIESRDTSVLSPKRTATYLCVGAGLGTLLGLFEIYRVTNIWELGPGWFIFAFVIYSFFAGCTLAPLLIILWNSALKKSNVVILSILIGVLVLICNILFAHSVFGDAEWERGRARLGFVYLWLGTLLVATVIFAYRKLSSRAVHER